MKKIDGKYKSQPIDSENCCGITCQMCESHCFYNAITVRPIEKQKRR